MGALLPADTSPVMISTKVSIYATPTKAMIFRRSQSEHLLADVKCEMTLCMMIDVKKGLPSRFQH
jgi:hypothetical protein